MVHATCAVRGCKSSTYINKDLRFHQFPRSAERSKLWLQACSRPDLFEKPFESLKHIYICSLHFEKHMRNKKALKRIAVPTLLLPSKDSSHYPQTDPQVQILGFKVSTPENPEGPQDRPLDLCRFCAEYCKDCVDVTSQDRPYLTRNKTALTLNDLSVELDFNNDTLPKTVCGICDRKLQAMYDFFKQVKDAQESLIKVDVKEEIEAVIVKTECESPTSKDEDDIDSKDGIIDSLTVTKTVVEKHCNKRKSVKAAPKTQKKPKIESKDIKSEETELIVDIKEEIPDTVNSYEDYEAENPEDDREIDVKPSVSGLATSALVNEMSDSETFS